MKYFLSIVLLLSLNPIAASEHSTNKALKAPCDFPTSLKERASVSVQTHSLKSKAQPDEVQKLKEALENALIDLEITKRFLKYEKKKSKKYQREAHILPAMAGFVGGIVFHSFSQWLESFNQEEA